MRSGLVLQVVLSTSAALSAGSKPSFLVLFVDDWGYGDLGENCLAASAVPGAQPSDIDFESSCSTATGSTTTPHMDALARGGMRFTDFHAGAAVCTPSRAALQTGRLGARTGVTSNFMPGSLGGLPKEELTIAQLLNDSYHSLAVGKWHRKLCATFGTGSDEPLPTASNGTLS
jgi:arylsulfatase G